jgi:hypothetical protein
MFNLLLNVKDDLLLIYHSDNSPGKEGVKKEISINRSKGANSPDKDPHSPRIDEVTKN